MKTNIVSPEQLSDTELVAGMMRAALGERKAMTELIALLGEFDTRQIYLRDGYPSFFAYCVRVFGFSEHETLNRIAVARAARKFPVILDLLAGGAVNLTSVRLLAPHLTDENHEAVLESARGKSTREVEKLAAALAPRPPVPDSIHKLRNRTQPPYGFVAGRHRYPLRNEFVAWVSIGVDSRAPAVSSG